MKNSDFAESHLFCSAHCCREIAK